MSKLLWTQKQDIGPKPRVLHALAFDSAAARTILFGGDSLNGQTFGDTWSWDGDNWTQVADIGPAARAEHALAYDSVRNRVVMFGGTVAGTSVRDTWEWADDAWTQVADTGPSARSGHAMAFDPARGKVVLFGGGAVGGSAKDDTWEWDGSDWVQTEDTGPSPRRAHSMTFDSARGRVVLFGGFGGPGPNALNDTWEYDAGGGSWTEVADIGPEPCFHSALVFKKARSELFGGASGPAGGAPPPSIFGFSWEWDGKHWTARQDIGPGPRVGHAMAYDSARDRVVLFGGAALPLDDAQAATSVVGDTWEQFEVGTLAGPGPGPAPTPGPEVALSAFTVNPSVAQPGDTVAFSVTLVGPAGAGGQVVPITDDANNPELSVPVDAGSTFGQVAAPLDPNLGSMMPLPVTLNLIASAGGVSIQTQLQINP